VTNPVKLLNGIRVVSLEQYIGAPYCTSMLADAGAEVIKVEQPGQGDPRRAYDPRRGEGDDALSGGFASYNRGKRSVCIDITTPEGAAKLDQLLATADVLVSNLRPGALARRGFGQERLRGDFPALGICEISGVGQTGPYSAWPAFDSVIQGMSGLSSLLGASPDEAPQLAPMGTMDLLGGIYAAVGILAALVSRATTGQGSYIDASMFDIGAAFLERPLTLHEFTGEIPLRGRDDFSPVGNFVAGDGGWVSVVIPTDEMWRRCCEAIGQPELVTHPELDTVVKRATRMRDLVLPILTEWAKELTRDEALARLRATGQPAGAVLTIDEVRRDPHLAERGLFQPILNDAALEDDGTRLSLPRLPLLIDGVGAEPGPVPRLGETTVEALVTERP
jgi:CoA:oxalate CoA-transferase